ncbi:MAG: IS66 family transposase [Candidatus Syntropharchaeia archaeon]
MRKPKRRGIPLDALGRRISSNIEAIYENKCYDVERPCTMCNSDNYTKLGKRKRLFCRLIKENVVKDIYVYLKEFRCKNCGHVYTSPAPFYKNAGFGKVIVDLVLYLTSFQNYNQTEKTLNKLGIHVDRDTIRKWTSIFREKGEEYYEEDFKKAPMVVNILEILFQDNQRFWE